MKYQDVMKNNSLMSMAEVQWWQVKELLCF